MWREEESTRLSFPSVLSKQKCGQPVVQGTALWSVKSCLFLFQPCHRKWIWKWQMRVESSFLPPCSAVRSNPWCCSFCWGHLWGRWSLPGKTVLLPNFCKCFGNFICKLFVFWSGSECEGGRTAAPKADVVGDKFTSHSFLLHLITVSYSYPSPWQLLECCMAGNVPRLSITLWDNLWRISRIKMLVFAVVGNQQRYAKRPSKHYRSWYVQQHFAESCIDRTTYT